MIAGPRFLSVPSVMNFRSFLRIFNIWRSLFFRFGKCGFFQLFSNAFLHDCSKVSTVASIADGALASLLDVFLTYSLGSKSSLFSKSIKRARMFLRRRLKSIGRLLLFGGRLRPKPRFNPRIDSKFCGSLVDL